MIKKLLLIFISIFAFSNLNAQSNLVTQATCGNTNEYQYVDLVNGKNHYQRLTVGNITSLGMSYGAVGGSNSVHIAFDGTQWVVYRNNNITDIVYYQNIHTAGVLPPDSGWVGDGSPCPTTETLTIPAGGTLGVGRDLLESNSISVYPNPSSDFIKISNLQETSNLRITNITGQTVLNTTVSIDNNQIDIKNLSRGFYFVEIQGKKTIKLIKK